MLGYSLVTERRDDDALPMPKLWRAIVFPEYRGADALGITYAYGDTELEAGVAALSEHLTKEANG